jgi:predicted RNA binding protein YcfA (HicA-like mRNA interferase family)
MASMSYRELVALFRKNGIEFVREAKGDHEIWYSPITRRRLTVPRNLKGEGTLQRILRDSGLKAERDRD